MKFNSSFLKNTLFLLIIVAASASVLMGQKKPTSLKLDVDIDDMQLCGGQDEVILNGVKTFDQQQQQQQIHREQGRDNIKTSQFCVLFRSYYNNLNSNNLAAAQNNRNDMIEIVRGQVDTFYKRRKDGRSSKIRVFQTILDFLRIGGDLAVTITNGARAKTIIGATLSGLDSGHTAFNKNFEVLQTQVLINKMNTNRADIFSEIIGNQDKQVRSSRPSEAYSWYAAKNDLRRYLLAGTFDNALDTLVRESGADVVNAEKKLRTVEKRSIVNEFSTDEVITTDNVETILEDLQEKLILNADDENATKKLAKIYEQLNEIPSFKLFFAGRKITSQSNGKEIYEALVDLRREVFRANDRDSVRTIEDTIIKLGK